MAKLSEKEVVERWHSHTFDRSLRVKVTTKIPAEGMARAYHAGLLTLDELDRFINGSANRAAEVADKLAELGHREESRRVITRKPSALRHVRLDRLRSWYYRGGWQTSLGIVPDDRLEDEWAEAFQEAHGHWDENKVYRIDHPTVRAALARCNFSDRLPELAMSEDPRVRHNALASIASKPKLVIEMIATKPLKRDLFLPLTSQAHGLENHLAEDLRENPEAIDPVVAYQLGVLANLPRGAKKRQHAIEVAHAWLCAAARLRGVEDIRTKHADALQALQGLEADVATAADGMVRMDFPGLAFLDFGRKLREHLQALIDGPTPLQVRNAYFAINAAKHHHGDRVAEGNEEMFRRLQGKKFTAKDAFGRFTIRFVKGTVTTAVGE